MAKALARWSGTKVTREVGGASGHTAAVDEGPIIGDDKGMRPTEMLLGALGSCTGLNVVLLLKKFKQPLASLAVAVEGGQGGDCPRAFTKIDITFVTGCSGDFDKKMVDEAIDLACNRYCPIHATLSHGVTI